MSELRPVLERLREGVAPSTAASDGFESLHRRRQRRALRRRLTAGAVASVVAIAGVGVVMRAFDPGDVVVREPAIPEIDPRITATFPVGTRGQVSGIVAGFGSLWVTAHGVPGGGGADDYALLRIDPLGNQVVDTIPLLGISGWETGGGGIDAGAGSIWVTGGVRTDGQQQGLLSRIDPNTLEVQAILLGGDDAASDVGVSDDGVWVTGRRDGRPVLMRFDPSSGELDAREVILRGEVARRVVVTDDSVLVRQWVWHGNQGPCGLLTSVDPGAVTTIAEEPQAGVCGGIDGWFLYNDQIWSTTDGGFGRVDPTTGSISGPIHPYATESTGPRSHPVVDATGVWFGAYPGGNGSAPDRLSRFDPASGAIETFELEVGWSAAAVLDGTIWALGWEGVLTRIDLFDQPEPSAQDPTRMTVEDVFRYSTDEVNALAKVVVADDSVWVLDLEAFQPRRRAAVLRLDPATGRVLSRTEVPGANDLTVLGESIWVLRKGEGGGTWLTQVDRGSGVPLGSIALPQEVYGGPILAYEGDLWVPAVMSDTAGDRLEIIRIDPQRGEIVSEIPAPVCSVIQGGCLFPTELIGAGGAVWAAGPERGQTLRLDVETERMEVLETGAVAGLAAHGGRVWIATQPVGETVSANRWWDGHLELVALEAGSGRPVEGPIPMAGQGWPFEFAGVPFAVVGGDVVVWGVNADRNGLVVTRIGADGSAADDSVVIPDKAFLEDGRAVFDEQRNVIWIVGSAYELTKIALPG